MSQHLKLKWVILVGILFSTNAYTSDAYFATLDGQQEAAPTASTATGSASLSLNAAQDRLTYTIKLTGLDLDGTITPEDADDDVVALHFHVAPPGTNGAVVFGQISPNDDADDLVINAAAGTLTGAWENSDAKPLSGQLANLLADGLYLNVHTTEYPGGAIRGQVLVKGDGITLDFVHHVPRDTPPVTCIASRAGSVYMQRDIANVSPLTHLLCTCIGLDGNPPAYSWRGSNDTVDCATLLAP